MLGITRRDRKQATWIREQTKVDDILMALKIKKWSWAGHIMRRMDNRWAKSNGMATKKLEEKPGEAKNQVERRNSGIR